VQAWYEADKGARGRHRGLRQAVDALVSQLANANAEDIAAETNSDADRQFLSQGYAEWIVG
jgi:hypothetical protein